MLAARRIFAVLIAVSLVLLQTAEAQAAGSSASGASTVSSGEYAKHALLQGPSIYVDQRVHGLVRYVLFFAAMGDLVRQFAASQAQSQLGLASQVFGLNSGSNSHPFLQGSTSDRKFAPMSFSTVAHRTVETADCCCSQCVGLRHEQAERHVCWCFQRWESALQFGKSDLLPVPEATIIALKLPCNGCRAP